MKIFCISYPRTGTGSLFEAFAALGYRSWHYKNNPYDYVTIAYSLLCDHDKFFSHYDFFADLPIPFLYKELDRNFPGSKFILVTRDAYSWHKSWRNAYESVVLKNLALNRGIDRVFLNDMFGTDGGDFHKMTDSMLAHNEAVKEYFQGRKDFFLSEFPDCLNWEFLGSVLGSDEIDLPLIPFPHRNRGDDPKYQRKWGAPNRSVSAGSLRRKAKS